VRDSRPYGTSELQGMSAKLRSGRTAPSGRDLLPLLKTSRDDLVSQDEMLSFSAACGPRLMGSNELRINLKSTANQLWHMPLPQLVNYLFSAKMLPLCGLDSV